MRSVILDFLKANKHQLKPYTLTENLPWEDNGQALYHHNRTYIYVDTPQTSQDAVADYMNQAGFVNEITTVSVYFVNDAKQLPSNYDKVVDVIKGARTAAGTEGYISRTVQVSSDYIADDLRTVFEFSFRKLITN